MLVEELRKYKIFDLALFDLLVAMIFMISLFIVLWRLRYPNLDRRRFVITGILLTIPMGILFHVIFGINTELNYRLGLSNKPV